jgi:hypothetical protein
MAATQQLLLKARLMTEPSIARVNSRSAPNHDRRIPATGAFTCEPRPRLYSFLLSPYAVMQMRCEPVVIA